MGITERTFTCPIVFCITKERGKMSAIDSIGLIGWFRVKYHGFVSQDKFSKIFRWSSDERKTYGNTPNDAGRMDELIKKRIHFLCPQGPSIFRI